MRQVPAILWDGFKRLQGSLVLDDHRVRFEFCDFSDTDLEFDLAYLEILSLNYYNLFDLQNAGIEIISKGNHHNVFIIEQTEKVMALLKAKLSNASNPI